MFGFKDKLTISSEVKNKFFPLIALGLTEGLASIFFLTGLKNIGPVLTSFIAQFVFVFVLISSLILLKEKFNLPEFFGIVLAIAGVFIINWNQNISIIGGSF